MTLSQVDTNHVEGRLLIAALAMISMTTHSDKQPDIILQEVDECAAKIYGETHTKFPELDNLPRTFDRELAQAINRFSKENDSNTPDFILAEYLQDCLAAFAKASRAREKWYGKELKII